MVHSIHFFTSVTSSIQISVRLPNGEMVKVTHVGTVKISATLILENVLCIPTFYFLKQTNSKPFMLLHLPFSLLFSPGLTALEDDWVG